MIYLNKKNHSLETVWSVFKENEYNGVLLIVFTNSIWEKIVGYPGDGARTVLKSCENWKFILGHSKSLMHPH